MWLKPSLCVFLKVGNPETDDYYDSKGLLEYAWSHSVVSDQVYKHATKVCDFRLFNWTDECSAAMDIVFNQYRIIDIYNIYDPKCNLPQSSSLGDDDSHEAGAKVRCSKFVDFETRFFSRRS